MNIHRIARILVPTLLLCLLALVPAASGQSRGGGLMEPLNALGNFLDDTGITTEIKVRLAAEKGMEGSDISVTTDGAVVHLEGRVRNAAQAALAERVARDLGNVRGVINNLIVAAP